jgi:transglutaminase-like putative cysteine protease
MPSALQVLKTMKGDCNEHSILTVAILRALGIPSRVVFGLVYDSGSFFYHAWVEAFDGKNWIEFDPTWGLFPADILRIRIGTGNVSEWVKVLEYVGKIKIKFIDWQ